MSYTNADGLFILTDRDQGTVGGEGVTAVAHRQSLVIDITAANTALTFGAANIDPLAPQIPAGAIIVNADLVVTTAFTSGGSAALNIGTYLANGTAVAATGIDSAVALTAIDAIGEVVQCDGTLVSGTATVGTAPVLSLIHI
jgi:hypothetical protein